MSTRSVKRQALVALLLSATSAYCVLGFMNRAALPLLRTEVNHAAQRRALQSPLLVATSDNDVAVESSHMPELGKDGLYHVQSEAQHR